MIAWLVIGLVVLSPLLVWGGLAVRREARLARMQRWAAWNWELAREFRHFRGLDGLRLHDYQAQAEHLDRHIRAAREGRPDA